jgi:hypothetical protein
MENINVDGEIKKMLAEGRDLYYIIGFLKGTLERKGNQEKALAEYEKFMAERKAPYFIIGFLQAHIERASPY